MIFQTMAKQRNLIFWIFWWEMMFFSNFGKKWRFFKNQPKLKIFHNFVVIDDFSNFGKIWRFFKIWYNQRNVIFCKNRWFLKFWQKMKIFQILVKIEDFSNFGKNWWFFKLWQNLKIFQNLIQFFAKTDDF